MSDPFASFTSSDYADIASGASGDFSNLSSNAFDTSSVANAFTGGDLTSALSNAFASPAFAADASSPQSLAAQTTLSPPALGSPDVQAAASGGAQSGPQNTQGQQGSQGQGPQQQNQSTQQTAPQSAVDQLKKALQQLLKQQAQAKTVNQGSWQPTAINRAGEIPTGQAAPPAPPGDPGFDLLLTQMQDRGGRYSGSSFDPADQGALDAAKWMNAGLPTGAPPQSRQSPADPFAGSTFGPAGSTPAGTVPPQGTSTVTPTGGPSVIGDPAEAAIPPAPSPTATPTGPAAPAPAAAPTQGAPVSLAAGETGAPSPTAADRPGAIAAAGEQLKPPLPDPSNRMPGRPLPGQRGQPMQGDGMSNIIRDVLGLALGNPAALGDLARQAMSGNPAAAMMLPMALGLMGGMFGGGGRGRHGGFRGGRGRHGGGFHHGGEGHWPYHAPGRGWQMHDRHPGPPWVPISPRHMHELMDEMNQGQNAQNPMIQALMGMLGNQQDQANAPNQFGRGGPNDQEGGGVQYDPAKTPTDVSGRGTPGVNANQYDQFTRQYARSIGVDPDVASHMLAAESAFGQNIYGDYRNGRPTSFGGFQLHVTGPQGMAVGDAYMRLTGHKPWDTNYWQEQVKFALDWAKKNGWSPWVRSMNKNGYGEWSGIGGPQTARAQPSTPPPAAAYIPPMTSQPSAVAGP